MKALRACPTHWAHLHLQGGLTGRKKHAAARARSKECESPTIHNVLPFMSGHRSHGENRCISSNPGMPLSLHRATPVCMLASQLHLLQLWPNYHEHPGLSRTSALYGVRGGRPT